MKKSVKVLIQNRKQGIARDIVKEAQNGYAADHDSSERKPAPLEPWCWVAWRPN